MLRTRAIDTLVYSFSSKGLWLTVEDAIATKNQQEVIEGAGAACVTRTRDPIITNDVLYRLS